MIFCNPIPEENDLKILYENGWRNPAENKSEVGVTGIILARQYVSKLMKELKMYRFKRKKNTRI